jgi:hypothetical protein
VSVRARARDSLIALLCTAMGLGLSNWILAVSACELQGMSCRNCAVHVCLTIPKGGQVSI